MKSIAIVGTGYVADLYMRSLATFPDIKVLAAYDHDPQSLSRFCQFWKVAPAKNQDEILQSDAVLILNLTNPRSHYAVSKSCLEAGKHVYSEKPLATEMSQAYELHALAASKGLQLASAPCSVLSRAAQSAWLAVRRGDIGKPLLVYAELDDDFISQAPYTQWISESGAPWPFRDEFEVGCTLEHAGYYLTWLMAMFGSVETVVSCSARIVADKLPPGAACAPDFSSATLLFSSGVVARLTCSIVARHDHRFRVFGDKGMLEIEECWNNAAAVKVRRRYVVRRRLINSPFATKVAIKGETHPMLGRRGAAAMNFALGPAEVLAAIAEGRPSRLSADFALHLNEVTLAIQNAEANTGAQKMQTKCPAVAPMPWAMGTGGGVA